MNAAQAVKKIAVKPKPLNTEPIDTLTSKDQHVQGSLCYLGLDTEMLVKTGKNLVWAHERGLPQERKPLDLKTSDGTSYFDWHADGYAHELCVLPASCLDVMMSNIARGFSWLAVQYNKNEKGVISAPLLPIEIIAPAVYKVPESVIKEAKDDVKRLGCMPSLNVYGEDSAGDPKILGETTRTTGCHLHLSHPALQTKGMPERLVKWADVLVGNTWAYITPDPMLETERRKAYGRAGEYRLKLYDVYPKSQIPDKYSAGVEYRVLPGTVLYQPQYFTLLFNLYRSALRIALEVGDDPPKILTKFAVRAINTGSKAAAKKVIDALNFNPRAKRYIELLHKKPLTPLTMQQWADAGYQHRGHQASSASLPYTPGEPVPDNDDDDYDDNDD